MEETAVAAAPRGSDNSPAIPHAQQQQQPSSSSSLSSGRDAQPAASLVSIPPPPPVHSPAKPVGTCRQMFSVELRPGETTIVSWKKLLKESGLISTSLTVPTAESVPVATQAGPSNSAKIIEGDPTDAAAPNRFNAVIEKIERLYMGKQSSDEEDLDDVPDDDQYDTEDSFIDDTELDEYFEVDNLKTKHDGYFVNKGQLEKVEPNMSHTSPPKRRKRKDFSAPGEMIQDLVLGLHATVTKLPVKSAPRNAQYGGNNISANIMVPVAEQHCESSKQMKNKLNGPVGSHRKSSDFDVNNEGSMYLKSSSKDVPPSVLGDSMKHKPGASRHVGVTHKPRRTTDIYNFAYSEYQEKGLRLQRETQLVKFQNGLCNNFASKVRRKEKHRIGQYSDQSNIFGSIYPMQPMMTATARTGESVIKHKGTRLERAIRDLEKIVAESRPPTIVVKEVDAAGQVVKRRLPQEVKLKLAKVARLSAIQGKISEDDLIDRLMGILGHLVQRKTLKRNMKEMVELGLSAKQEKADRFQLIKKEIDEMVRVRVAYSKSQDGDDFQEVIDSEGRRIVTTKFIMDAALEDKICELYDLYVEGMDEDKGPQCRKLYVELAELWPHGYMDNVGIKDAINRSKERKRALYRQDKVRKEERIKRRKMAVEMGVFDINLAASQGRSVKQKPAIEYTSQVMTFSDKHVSVIPTASNSKLLVDPSHAVIDFSQFHASKVTEKPAKSTNVLSAPANCSRDSAVDLTRSIKSELDAAEPVGKAKHEV